MHYNLGRCLSVAMVVVQQWSGNLTVFICSLKQKVTQGAGCTDLLFYIKYQIML